MSRLEQIKSKVDGVDIANQKRTKYIRERQRHLDGNTQSKGYKAMQRRAKDAEFVRDLFPRMQFNRALGQMLNGRVTEENKKHVFDNSHKYEQVIERYETEKGSKVTITIVAFTPPNSENSS